MNRATATPAPRSARPEREPVVVLTEHADVPTWVRHWCHRRGHDLRVVQVRSHARHGPPEELVQAVTDLAGHHLLVLRSGPDRPPPATVVAAIGELPKDDAVLADGAECAAALSAPLVVTHGVPLSFGERSVGLPDTLTRGERLVETAARRVAARLPDGAVRAELVRERPQEWVVRVSDADLLVLGLARHRSHRLGPVTSSALHAALSATLFVPTGGGSGDSGVSDRAASLGAQRPAAVTGTG